ncbi:hypothetical protein [Pseudomonas sp. CFBP 8772]|jgi:hypothetical protein|uniref:hypothetical protein n=1 Tax=Pseudomonas sp. CFBP 8772 TaxID=2775284 RepID=UPI0010DD3A86|nr:hypothetical protein [Pseudomonas sp. CFBP 8772]MBD8596649.1 hypothetical protein [Pseudomonas sp. CFBP 8772]RZA30842.1 MAG: hypothetical protein EOP02_00120 [Pseudomonadota bacterium]
MQPYRLLDETEQRFHQNFLHRNGNTQVTSLLTVPGCVSAVQARKAFAQLIADYPFLRQKIVPISSQRYGFVQVEDHVHATLCATQPPLCADALLKLELNCLLGDQEGWRALVVPDPAVNRTHILLTRNHAISDGYSTARLVNSLTLYLGSTPSGADDLQPGAFHLRLHHWRESPIETGKASYADFLRLQVSADAAQRIGQLRETSGFTSNAIWGGVFAYSYLRHTGVPALDLFTAYSLRDPSGHAEPLSKACLIDVRKATFSAEPLDLMGCIERYGWVVSQDKAQLRAKVATPVRHVDVADNPTRPALAFTNTGLLDRFLTPPTGRVLGFSTLVNRSGGNYEFVLHLGRFNGTWHAALAFSSLKVHRAAACAFKSQIEAALCALPAAFNLP